MKEMVEKIFGRTDFKLFWPTLGMLLVTIIYLAVDPKSAGDTFSGIYNWLTMHFSFGFLFGVGVVVFVCFGIAFSKIWEHETGQG